MQPRRPGAKAGARHGPRVCRGSTGHTPSSPPRESRRMARLETSQSLRYDPATTMPPAPRSVIRFRVHVAGSTELAGTKRMAAPARPAVRPEQIRWRLLGP